LLALFSCVLSAMRHWCSVYQSACIHTYSCTALLVVLSQGLLFEAHIEACMPHHVTQMRVLLAHDDNKRAIPLRVLLAHVGVGYEPICRRRP
jgi:hypothetical protein